MTSCFVITFDSWERAILLHKCINHPFIFISFYILCLFSTVVPAFLIKFQIPALLPTSCKVSTVCLSFFNYIIEMHLHSRMVKWINELIYVKGLDTQATWHIKRHSVSVAVISVTFLSKQHILRLSKLCTVSVPSASKPGLRVYHLFHACVDSHAALQVQVLGETSLRKQKHLFL